MIRLLTSLLLMLAFAPARLDAAGDRPNILLCVADDWGWPHAGAYGDRVVKTPAFDRLAREGLLFQHAFVSAPSCTPSRNALLTGQPFYRLDQGANLQSTLDVRHPNFMFLLRDAGYRVGHWRKVWGPGVFQAGGYAEHPAGPESTFEDFLQDRPTDQPFCFFFGAHDPHRPFDPGQGAKAGIPVDQIHVPGFLPANDTVRNDLADYYFEVQRWDADVARALDLLERIGELENTIVVMTGDNGMPFPRCKGNLYDWGARAPLAVRWGKGITKPGRQVDAFVSLTDLAPTFLTAAGVPVPPEMIGRPLQRLFQDTGPTPPAAGDWTYAVTGRERHAAAQEMPSLAGYPSRAIRTDRWLFILNLAPDRWPAGVPANATHPIGRHADCDDGPTKAFLLAHRADTELQRFYDLCYARRPAEELYDVQADPDQLNNLAADPAHRQTVEQLRTQLTTHLREAGDPRFTDRGIDFDTLPYRDDRIHRRVREWQSKQPTLRPGAE